MKRQLALLATLGLLATWPHAAIAADPTPTQKGPAKTEAADAPDKLDWLAFDAAATKAEAQKKHMIVDIYTTWCGWCKIMERETYTNPQVVAYLRENFILAKVNGESTAKLKWRGRDLTERQFAKAVGVNGYPSTYFFKPNAELLGGMSGFLMPPDFMIYAQYVATRWYEKGKIQAYADSIRASASKPPDAAPQ